MAAIGRDGNNQMFPLVVAVVESECRESWSWFLNLMIHSFGGFDLSGCTFISDRQKGLVESFYTIMPHTEHRFCVRHLYANFKLRFKDKAMKDLMWKAACSYSEEEFTKHMNEIKVLCNEAYEWLMNIPTPQWCKFALSPRPKCDMLSNNLCESFNNYIKEARELPILTMMEALRRKLMCRMQSKRQWIEKINGKICPRIQDKLNKIKVKSLDFECHMAAQGLWEVSIGLKAWVVNLKKYQCSCREWDMTGIPCAYACCAILNEHKVVEDFVSPYYTVEYYKKAYCHIIKPVTDHEQWSIPPSQGQELPILPPPFKKQIGRPKKMRKKGMDEINVDRKVTRRGAVQACSNCGDVTHNIRRCKKPPPEQPRKKFRSRKTKGTSQQHTTTGAQQQTPLSTQSERPPLMHSGQRNRPSASTQPVKGQRKRGRRGDSNGPQTGIGNWNGVGMFNQFRAPMQSGQSNRSQVNNLSDGGNVQMQVHNTRFGNVVFSNRSSPSNKFAVITDNGES